MSDKKDEKNELVVKEKNHADYIDKNLDTCSIAHELGHTQGLDETQAYEISNLCYQLVAKGIWRN